MRVKIIAILFIIVLLITLSSLFLKIVPCKSWYGSNTGIDDLAPHNGFCSISYSVGTHNEYLYLTSNPTLAFVIIFLVLFLIAFIIKKI